MSFANTQMAQQIKNNPTDWQNAGSEEYKFLTLEDCLFGESKSSKLFPGRKSNMENFIQVTPT